MEKRAEVKEREMKALNDIIHRLSEITTADKVEHAVATLLKEVIKIFSCTKNIRDANSRMELVSMLAAIDKDMNQTILKAVSRASGIFHNIGYRESCKKI